MAAYLSRMQERLPGLLEAFYLHGSLALEAYNPRFSDLDFIAITSHRLSEHEFELLAQVHREIKAKFPRPEWDGCYLGWQDLGRVGPAGAPFPAYFDGKLRYTRGHALNRVTWWLLKQHGVTVIGRPAQELELQVDWAELICNMHANLNSYWRRWASAPVRFAVLLTNWGIQWAVLGVARQFYSFREYGIVSKEAAGEHALANTPQAYERILREALSIRMAQGQDYYHNIFVRAVDARRFLKYSIGVCNENMEQWQPTL